MSLAAIPAYFLARRVVGTSLSLLAALLAVAVPSLAYTGTVMTENVFYHAVPRRNARPRTRAGAADSFPVALLVGLAALAFATRVQAATLVPAILLAPMILALEASPPREILRRFRFLYGTFVALGGLAIVVRLAPGDRHRTSSAPTSRLGMSYQFGEVLRYLAWHAAELTLYLLVVPRLQPSFW